MKKINIEIGKPVYYVFADYVSFTRNFEVQVWKETPKFLGETSFIPEDYKSLRDFELKYDNCYLDLASAKVGASMYFDYEIELEQANKIGTIWNVVRKEN